MAIEALPACEKCEELPGVFKCSCGARYCNKCFTTKHLVRNPKHKRGGTNTTDKVWAWISGTMTNLNETFSIVSHFEEDQNTKWFGLHVQKVNADDHVTRLVETSQFTSLAEASMHHNKNSPRRQFPSIVSFVGETGAGKSTLIRSLIQRYSQVEATKNLEAPVPGISSGIEACLPTTGEVNLYLDPNTFGTRHPQFLADCE
ncbi:hypothetical protein EJ04DRAFT_522206 [Polyplosphaeria fusca]|uniref:Uncharacterized protein n=1 Tax=Polyplosphaeria fusca TaxID=682080 RepID=A0A9P4R193_9PLEO|nr:hypothetical protein EJ04DRAFT_522206 [Polyplosphaeria fusca]